MKALDVRTVTTCILAGLPLIACAQTPAQPLSFEKLAAQCAPDVHPTTLKGVVTTESSWRPYAIGVVGGRLDRQPRSLAEAVATAHELERQGFNFSMGLGQVNRYNLPTYGETYETVFEPCRNLKAGSAILKDCYQRARAEIGDKQQALRAAFSCYYSGNFTRGFRPDMTGHPSYVQKVVANATGTAHPTPVVPAVQAQSTDGAVPARPVARAAGTAKTSGTPSQWVIFVDWSSGAEQATQAPGGAADSPAVKVQLVTPGTGDVSAAAAVRREPASLQRGTQALPEERPTPNSVEQDAPFVQYVN